MSVRQLLGPTSLLLIWWSVSALHVVSTVFVPTPTSVAAAWWQQITRDSLLQHLGATLYRTFGAFAIAVVAGLAVGLMLGTFKRLYEVLEIPLDFFRSLPSPVLIPVAMLLLGLGDAARISVAAFTCTLINCVQAAYAVRSLPVRRIQAARLLGARRWRLIRDVVVPGMLPALFAGWRITLSLSLIIIVVTEMFIGTQLGLGMRILDLHLAFRIPAMYAVVLTVGITGYAINKSIEVVEHRCVHWAGRS